MSKPKKPLGIGTVNQILKLHARGWSVQRIVHRTQISAARVKETLAEHGLRPLADDAPKKPPTYNWQGTPDPTPEEIAAATAEIRARWTPAIERSRCVHPVDEVQPYFVETRSNRKQKHDHNRQ